MPPPQVRQGESTAHSPFLGTSLLRAGDLVLMSRVIWAHRSGGHFHHFFFHPTWNSERVRLGQQLVQPGRRNWYNQCVAMTPHKRNS